MPNESSLSPTYLRAPGGEEAPSTGTAMASRGAHGIGGSDLHLESSSTKAQMKAVTKSDAHISPRGCTSHRGPDPSLPSAWSSQPRAGRAGEPVIRMLLEMGFPFQLYSALHCNPQISVVAGESFRQTQAAWHTRSSVSA